MSSPPVPGAVRGADQVLVSPRLSQEALGFCLSPLPDLTLPQSDRLRFKKETPKSKKMSQQQNQMISLNRLLELLLHLTSTPGLSPNAYN